jgi:UDP-N-acetylmuramoyl-L-alanyl-D-glutamate--2,6-diaminopimelate ligase
MELFRILSGIAVKDTNADKDYNIKNIRISSKDVTDGDLFLCMQGVKDDGNKYLKDINCDFIAVTEKKPADKNIKYVLVDNVREAYSLISQNWFLKPLSGIKFVAVVGTNGKTSTAHYLSSLLSFAGVKTGLIGTEGHYICGEKAGDSLTTPDPYELNELFFKMRAKGVEVVVSEVSAHAIYLEKLFGIKADLALFTNISQDHLDYFKNYENYSAVKMAYFNSGNVKKSIVNADDRSGALLARRLEKEGADFVTYGLENPADCFAIDVRENIDGLSFVANIEDEIIDVKSSLYGRFNAYNLLLALIAARELGISADTLSAVVKKVRAVKGRFSVLRCDKGTIIIDYAHTPDGLKNVLSTARTLTKGRLLCLFGCGGERDVSKRALMGEIAAEYSDFVVITSDNPRFEDPDEIIRNIESGMSGVEYKVLADRTEAINFAMTEMCEGDTLVIAGKGNEPYLDIRGKKIPYNDFDTVARWGVTR